MTTEVQPAYADVEEHDADDATVTEAAVALAVAEVLAHPPDVRGFTADQAELILDSAAGAVLRFYSQRVLQLFIASWRTGRPVDDRDYAVAQQATDRAVRIAVDDTGESVRDLVRASAERAAAGGGSGPVVIENGLTHEEAAYRRLQVGLESVSRVLVTRTRETAKYDFALKMGALGKAWRTKRDTKVRTTHGDLEGDFVLMGEDFVTVAGNKISRPGDPGAPLSETINCRCRLSYRMPI